MTGITVSEYIQKLRMDKACELLSDTSLTLTEISHEVGYQDVGYLRRMFKKRVGANAVRISRTAIGQVRQV